jgi:nucleotide-binding universal stress UspA family protein
MAKDHDHKVGYKRPPKATQFKPGQSGNPKGKPKGSHDLQRALAKALGGTVLVTTANGKQRLNLPETLVKKCASEALKGNMRAAELLLQLMAKLAAANGPPVNDNTEGDPEDEEILDRYRRKLLGIGAGQ